MTNNQLTEITQESNQIVLQAQKYEVTTQISYDSAGNFLKQVMTLKKRIELFFEPTINAFKKTKNEAEVGRKAEVEKMEKYLSPLEEAIQIVRQKCKEFENKAEQEMRAEQKRLEEQARQQAENEKKWGEKNPEVKVEEAKPVIAKTTGLGIKRTWKWKVVDEKLIPREFLSINEVAINKVVREQQAKTNIPGIQAYYE